MRFKLLVMVTASIASTVCFGESTELYASRHLFNDYRTRFGTLRFVDDAGSVDGHSTRVLLNGREILEVDRSGDGYGYQLELIPAGLSGGRSLDYAPRAKNGAKEDAELRRIVVIEGRMFDCAKQIIIIDLTMKTPFVSNRFGINPAGKGCLSFKDARWGVKESYVYLNQGTLKYYYPTGGKVIGPVD